MAEADRRRITFRSSARQRCGFLGRMSERNPLIRPQSNWPPSTEIVWPVTQLASGEARKTTTLATSSGWPSRPNGMLRRIAL